MKNQTYQASLAGFTDYSVGFQPTDTMWLIIGFVIWIGTFISVCPQIALIIKNRSSYGLSGLTVGFTSIGQFLMVIHYWHLHTSEFVGLLQMDPSIGFPRMLTFCNMASLWIAYLAIPFCMLIFRDKEVRERQKEEDRRAGWIVIVSTVFVLVGTGIVMFITYIVAGITKGFSSPFEQSIGSVYGTISALLVTAQYLPQMITTIKLKDRGSLSLLMLAIQAPGGFTNSMFMCFGQHEHWTTWVSFLVSALEQFVLLAICLFYTWRKKDDNEGLYGESLDTGLSKMSQSLLFNSQTENYTDEK